MNFQEMVSQTKALLELYSEVDKKRGKEWQRGEYVRALSADVGVLAKLTMAADGLRAVEDLDNKLNHELGDCLLALITIADKYDVDLEQAFLDTVKELENRADKNTLSKSHSL